MVLLFLMLFMLFLSWVALDHLRHPKRSKIWVYASLDSERDDFACQSGIMRSGDVRQSTLTRNLRDVTRQKALPRDSDRDVLLLFDPSVGPRRSGASHPRTARCEGRPRDGGGSQEPLGVAHSRSEAQDRV